MDVDQICSQYFSWNVDKNVDFIDSQNKGLTMKNLKLRVKSINWTNTTPTDIHAGLARKVNVQNKTKGSDIFGNVNTSKDSELSAKVTLTKGLVKGLNQKLSLPLPDEVKHFLGETIAIDPSKTDYEFSDKMTVGTTSGQDISAGVSAATATVSSTEGKYEGYFRCKVALTGNVQVMENSQSVLSADISEILKNYTQSGAEWDMEGHCEIKGNFEQTIVWQ